MFAAFSFGVCLFAAFWDLQCNSLSYMFWDLHPFPFCLCFSHLYLLCHQGPPYITILPSTQRTQSRFLLLHPSRDPCSIAQCKFNSLPLFLFAHFSSSSQETHTHINTHLGVQAQCSSTAAEKPQLQHCYCCFSWWRLHCQRKMLLVSTCCVYKTKGEKESQPVCVWQWPCSVSALSCGFITQSHTRTLQKGFTEKSLSALPQNTQKNVYVLKKMFMRTQGQPL